MIADFDLPANSIFCVINLFIFIELFI